MMCADPWIYYWLGMATAIAVIAALYGLYKAVGKNP